ncbi:MAG: glycoside hydrolase family 16 protein, partial [Clostridia bacterium]|nr:glycoside hydrolase family 16 protein [Clostridia bacterium]
GNTPGGETPGGDAPGGDTPTPPVTSVWNKEPTVKDTFYEDFSNGIDSDIWEVSNQKWGANNHGTSSKNVFYSTNEQRVSAADATGGIAVLRSLGDLQMEEANRRTGSALITRRTFGPGKYEVRMKVLPRLGQCTAFWTYYSNGGQTADTIKYSEIDIEMPMEGSYKKWSGTSYERFIDWNILAERQTVTSEDTEGLNDGKWHTYCFEWRTDAENGDRGVVWYRDGVKLGEARENVPIYTAALWVGNWFPPDKSWVGTPDFEEAYMYIDWIRVTEYNDPSQQGGGGSSARAEATDLGSRPIPQNNYIANGSFSGEEAGALIGWEGEGGAKGGSGSETYLDLAAGKRLTQTIRAQYAGYSFTLNANALEVSGAGKCKVYVEYMYGSVRMGTSEAIEFSASDIGTKNLAFTIGNPQVSDLRIVVETEDGTTARLNGVTMYMN